MPDETTTTHEPRAALAGRVAALARLIEAHPAFDLLAEYEAVFLDRHPCAGETVGCLERAADDLLQRIDATIALLEAAVAAGLAPTTPGNIGPQQRQPTDQPASAP